MKKFVAMLLAVSLVGGACGGSDSSNAEVVGLDGVQPTAVAGTQAGEDDEPEQELPPTPDPSSVSTESSGSSSESSDGETSSSETPTSEPVAEPATEAFDQAASLERAQLVLEGVDDGCAASVLLEEQLDNTQGFTLDDEGILEQQYRDSLTVARGIQSLVPPEIEADVATRVEWLERFIDKFDKADWDFINMPLTAPDELDAAVIEAAHNLDKYQFEQCGIGTDPGEYEPLFDPSQAPLDDIEEPETLADLFRQSFIDDGFTVEEADCIVDNIDVNDPALLIDENVLLQIMADCGVTG